MMMIYVIYVFKRAVRDLCDLRDLTCFRHGVWLTICMAGRGAKYANICSPSRSVSHRFEHLFWKNKPWTACFEV